MLGSLMETLRDAAAAPVTVARSIVAPGPEFAHDCRLIAVHLAGTHMTNLVPGQVAGFGLGGPCAQVASFDLVVTFVADCVPVPNEHGDPPKPADVTDWSTAWADDVERVHAALLAVDLSSFPGLTECDSYTVGDGIPTGPKGKTASIAWPVTVTPYA